MHRKRLITSLALIVALIASSLLFGQTPPTQPAQSSPDSQTGNAPTAQQQPATTPEGALTNQDVIKLSQIGLEPDVIITKINTAQQVAFKLETDDLIALKNAGVNQDVIAAMMKRASNSLAVPGSLSSGGVVDTTVGAAHNSGIGTSPKVFLVGIGSQSGLQSVLDGLSDFLSHSGVLVTQIDLGHKSRQDYIEYAASHGGVSLLYVTLDIGLDQFRDHMELACFNPQGKKLWEEDSYSMVSFSTSGAVKKLLRGMEKKIEPRIGNEGLPNG